MVCGLSRLSSMEGEFFGFCGRVFIPATSVPLPSLGTLAVLNPCRRGKMQPHPPSPELTSTWEFCSLVKQSWPLEQSLDGQGRAFFDLSGRSWGTNEAKLGQQIKSASGSMIPCGMWNIAPKTLCPPCLSLPFQDDR